MTRLLSTLVLLLGTCPVAWAQGGGRANTFDFGGGLADMDGVSLTAGGGSGLDVGNDTGWAIRGSYNFTDRIALGGEATWSNPSYRATLVPQNGGAETIRSTLDVATLHVKGTFYFLDKALTPFVEAGLGWSRIDSNIIEGPGAPGCWWDPWWGFICGPTFTTYADTRDSYSAAVGLRWDMSRDINLRVSWERLEVDTARDLENAGLDVLRVGVGWTF